MIRVFDRLLAYHTPSLKNFKPNSSAEACSTSIGLTTRPGQKIS